MVLRMGLRFRRMQKFHGDLRGHDAVVGDGPVHGRKPGAGVGIERSVLERGFAEPLIHAVIYPVLVAGRENCAVPNSYGPVPETSSSDKCSSGEWGTH